METVCIPQSELPGANALFLDFLNRFDRVRRWYPAPPNLRAAAEAASAVSFDSERRRALVDALSAQNAGADASVQKALDRLSDPNAVAVVTGQQTGLLGGPAYTIYKALSVIRLAEELERQGHIAAPVFWMATEDHDFAEIARAWTPGLHGGVEEIAVDEPAGVGGPVGPLPIDGEAVRRRLEQACFGQMWTSEAVALAGLDGRTSFGEAFRRWLQATLSGRGLITLDPLDPALRRLAQPAFRAVIERNDEILAAVAQRDRELEDAGYTPQVKTAKRQSLLFTVDNGARRPLMRRRDNFVFEEVELTPAEVLERLEQTPERFSPSALVRPAVQNALLPTAAYVGGAAEIAYFAQAEAVHSRVAGPMPPVYHRASFTIVDARRRKLLERYGLRPTDCWSHREALRDRIGATLRPAGLEKDLARERERIERALEAMRRSLADFDPTLAEGLEGSRNKIRYQLDKTSARAAKEALRRDERAAAHADELSDWFYPRKTLQERVYSFLGLQAQLGPALLPAVEKAIQPECPDHQLLIL